jgi:hypothetical protein
VTEFAEQIQETAHHIAALEAKYPTQEMRPWACNDHPIAMEHWKLVQRRIRLKRESGTARPALTAEQRAAVTRRLCEGKRAATSRRLRENHGQGPFPLAGIDGKPPGDPELPRNAKRRFTQGETPLIAPNGLLR